MMYPFNNGLNSNGNDHTFNYNDVVSMDIAPPIPESNTGHLKQYSKKGSGFVEVMLPIETVSEANGGRKVAKIVKGKKRYVAEHWSDKHRRHKRQHGMVLLALKPLREYLPFPAKITLTRYAPNKLDKFDNLPMSMKYILDMICAIITGDYRPGRADGNEDFIKEVYYQQNSSKDYWVKILIEKC